MSRSQVVLVLVAVVLLSIGASATCSLPSSSGVKICGPGVSATVSQPAHISASAKGNAAITKMAVYVDGTRVYFDAGNELDIVDSTIQEGPHKLTVRAWDTSGATYTSSRAFTVASGSVSSCKPSSAGVKFCSPASQSLQPMNDITVVAGATGNGARITRLKVIWQGSVIADTTSDHITLQAGTGIPGYETMTAKAWDSAGHTYSSTTTFKTYYAGICSDFGCDPGVFIQSPSDGSTVGSSFHLSSEVRGNPAPITSMRAYLDGQTVASSGGPTLSAEISAAPGSHRLTVQAWDSQGKLYRTVYRVTAQ